MVLFGLKKGKRGAVCIQSESIVCVIIGSKSFVFWLTYCKRQGEVIKSNAKLVIRVIQHWQIKCAVYSTAKISTEEEQEILKI